MDTASEPHRSKSHHSNTVPSDGAKMTFFSSLVIGALAVADAAAKGSLRPGWRAATPLASRERHCLAGI